MKKQAYGKILCVEAGSPAEAAGIHPGDELLSINGQPVRDLLEYQFLQTEEELELEIKWKEHVLSFLISKEEDEPLGLDFEEELFDGLHTCRNKCVFCFLHQMPRGMRRSLYVRDDDYRLSLAHGNYITLSNVSDEELERICRQRMSPIYVSVHAADPELRVRMLGNKRAGCVMDQLRALAEARITMHTQIVLVPGFNDGEHLERTVRELASLHPWVASIAVVPVGLTEHRENLIPLRTVDRELAESVVDLCARLQREFRRKLGERLIYPSDEFYLLAGRDFPSATIYDGFPQLENGVGGSRLFLDDLKRLEPRAERLRLKPGRYVLVTGTLAASLIQRLADALNRVDGVHARVLPVENRFFGETVTVAGLLTGRDVAAALSTAAENETALIPDIMLNEDRFLDDMTVAELRGSVGASVLVVPSCPGEMAKALIE